HPDTKATTVTTTRPLNGQQELKCPAPQPAAITQTPSSPVLPWTTPYLAKSIDSSYPTDLNQMHPSAHPTPSQPRHTRTHPPRPIHRKSLILTASSPARPAAALGSRSCAGPTPQTQARSQTRGLGPVEATEPDGPLPPELAARVP